MKTLEDYIAIETREEDVRCKPVHTGVHFGGMETYPWPRRSDDRIRQDAQVRMDRARIGAAPTMFRGF